MILIKLSFISLLVFSCKVKSNQNDSFKTTVKNWKVKFKAIQIHSYKKPGILDSTIRIESFYDEGKEIMQLRFLVTRKYDKFNHLIRERKFLVLDNDKISTQGYDETIWKYDNNNLVERIELMHGILYSNARYFYNNYGKEIKRIEINKSPDILIEEIGAKYDTATILSHYDSVGNIVRVTTNKLHPKISYTNLISYEKGIKTFSYLVNASGDTTSISKFTREGPRIREISNNSFTLYEGEKIIEEQNYLPEGNIATRDTYRYDNFGNEVEHVTYE